MRTPTLLKVWLVLGIGWLMIFWPLLNPFRREGDPAWPAGWITWTAWLLFLALGSSLALHVFYCRAALRHSGEAGGFLVIDASPTTVLPGFAQGLGAVGLTLLLGQGRPTCGGIVLGLLLTGLGAFFLRRDVLRIDLGERRVWKGSHLLGAGLSYSELVLPEMKPLRLERVHRRGIVLFVGPVALASGLDTRDAPRIAEAVGRALFLEVKDNTVHAVEESTLFRVLHWTASSLPAIAVLFLLARLAVAWSGGSLEKLWDW